MSNCQLAIGAAVALVLATAYVLWIAYEMKHPMEDDANEDNISNSSDD